MTAPTPSGSVPRSRPLSPHLQVWRWTLTMTASILHRATGVALSVGLLALTWWLAAAAMGEPHYAVFMDAVRSDIGQWMLLGWLFAMYLHLASGFRHLVMDAGGWLTIKETDRAIILLTLAAIGATAGTWAYLKGWM